MQMQMDILEVRSPITDTKDLSSGLRDSSNAII